MDDEAQLVEHTGREGRPDGPRTGEHGDVAGCILGRALDCRRGSPASRWLLCQVVSSGAWLRTYLGSSCIRCRWIRETSGPAVGQNWASASKATRPKTMPLIDSSMPSM